MHVVFFVLAGIIALWSAVKMHVIYRSIVDSFPPQFQDDLSSRYAFPVLVLTPPTPLELQAEYMKSLLGSCAVFLCVSLGCFAARNAVFGCFVLVVFIWSVFSTVRSWRTYKENCERPAVRNERDET
jgi:hypothetical protein